LKRALKKREKAVLENTPSDDAPVEQTNVVHSLVNCRMPTKAAMIGLAISMGATSLLVTRQSDQALAAEPVGNQNTASTLPAASDTEVKFASTKSLESPVVSSVSVPEHHAVVEPTAISQVSGLGAKWQEAANKTSVPTSAPVVVPSSVKEQGISGANLSLQQSNQLIAGTQGTSFNVQQQPVGTSSLVGSEVNDQLKAQQEFAINRLQEKSDQLRRSLAQFKSGSTKNVAEASAGLAQPITVAQTTPQASTSVTGIEQSEIVSSASRRAKLVSKLRQRSMGQMATPIPVAPVSVAPSTPTAYEVKPGDTLAQIASHYGTSVSDIVSANNLANPNRLQISQKLTIPTENNTVAQETVASNPAVVVSSNTNVTNTSRNSALPKNSSTPILVPTPANSQFQAITEPTPVNGLLTSHRNKSETVPPASSAYGMGGDSPVPQALAEMQVGTYKAETAKTLKQNPRLRSLQEEIEKLREKYRAQQSGNPVATEASQTTIVSEQIPVPQVNTQGVSVPVYSVNRQQAPSVSIPTARPSTQAIQIPVARLNNQAIQIPVPRAMELNYSAQPVKSQAHVTRASDDEAINPDFLPNPTTKSVIPSGNTDASQSLGRLRGTTVSPSLPPLAAVDRYLPKPIDDSTPVAGNYIWPAKGVLTSGFGMRWGRMHKGIDVANSTGTPVVASADGVIEKAGWNNGGYGNLVDIRHTDGSLTRYGHNSKILVRVGQQVHQGETIALMGSTGFSTGPHSHFEVHPAGKGAVNPIAFLPRI